MSDVDNGFLTIAGICIAALLGYWFGRQRWLDEKRDRARDLATALLIELRHVEDILREMNRELRPLDFEWYVALPWFEKLFPDTRFFSPATTQAAYQFLGLVQEIEARRADALRLKQVSDSDHWAIRVKAGAAVQRLAELVAALKMEGGAVPPVTNVQHFSQGQLPVLPPRIFPPFDAPSDP